MTRDDPEITLAVIWHHTAVSVSLLVGTYIVEFPKAFFFPHGVPFTSEEVLMLGEFTMIALALLHVARILSCFMPTNGMRPRISIGPVGWGIVGALVLLATTAFS